MLLSMLAAALTVGIADMCPSNGHCSAHSYYPEALSLAGHTPLILPRVSDPGAYGRMLSKVDVLLLAGGADIEPARYGAEKGSLSKTHPVRDEFEFAVLDAARARRLPVFGICRGAQMVNVYFGGTLWQDLPSEFIPPAGVRKLHAKDAFRFPYDGSATNPPAHSVCAVAGSRLAGIIGEAPLLVNSHHHQAVRTVAPGFRVSAYSPDGVPEAIEGDCYPAAGVQFHPEAIVAAAPGGGFEMERLVAIFRRLDELLGR